MENYQFKDSIKEIYGSIWIPLKLLSGNLIGYTIIFSETIQLKSLRNHFLRERRI